MSNYQLTLNDFFSAGTKELHMKGDAAVESIGQLKSMKESLFRKTKEVKWSVAFREIMNRIEKLLDLKLTDIMIDAWSKHQSVREFMENSKKKPDDIFLLPLTEHEISSSHRPYVEILVNEEPLGKVDFTVEIIINLEGILLKIQNGRIIEIVMGSCKGSGSVACEDVTLIERELEKLNLPGSIVIDNN